jgi:hypothetical protein
LVQFLSIQKLFVDSSPKKIMAMQFTAEQALQPIFWYRHAGQKQVQRTKLKAA